MREHEDEQQLLDSREWLPAGSAACACCRKKDRPVARVRDEDQAPFGCRACMHLAMRMQAGMAQACGEDAAAQLPDWTEASV